MAEKEKKPYREYDEQGRKLCPPSPVNGNQLPNIHGFSDPEVQKKACVKGAKISGEHRHARKLLREELQALLAEDVKTKKGVMQANRAISVSMIEQAMKGSVKAFEAIRDTVGEKPVENVALAADFSELDKISFTAEAAKKDKE